MKLSSTLRYDAAPAQVFSMLIDEDFIALKTKAANAIRHVASVDVAGDGATIRLTRIMPPDVPDFVRRFVGDTIDIQQTDVWGPPAADGSREGTIELSIAGAPVKAHGTMQLRPEGSGTVITISGDVKASIPLFGGQVEKTVLEGLNVAAEREQATGNVWLAERS
jgi:hypothetical protein